MTPIVRTEVVDEFGSSLVDPVNEVSAHLTTDVLRDLKANASGWMHDVFPEERDFSWQRGYAAFTVSQSNVMGVQRYIAGQEEHHKRVSFRDEFIQFLKANGIEYDERYL